MTVDKVINNNLIRSIDEKHQEILVMGSGLGFKKRPGDPVDEEKIEKVYVLSKEKNASRRLVELLSKIPVEHIRAANEIVSLAKISLGKELNDNIYITLTDHINFAIERISQGVVIKNALLWEIKRFYNHEYLIGKEALQIIKRRLDVELPEDEAGFIALHLVNALMDSQDIRQTTEMTTMIQNIISIVKYHFNMELDECSLHYERFITHLKFFAQRVLTNTEVSGESDSFLKALREEYQKEYRCALKVRNYILKEFGKELEEDELVYLTVHIRRVTTK